jgi:hypothetical protein
MKAARIHRFGPPEVFEVEDIPRPSPAPGEVLVRSILILIVTAHVMKDMRDSAVAVSADDGRASQGAEALKVRRLRRPPAQWLGSFRPSMRWTASSGLSSYPSGIRRRRLPRFRPYPQPSIVAPRAAVAAPSQQPTTLSRSRRSRPQREPTRSASSHEDTFAVPVVPSSRHLDAPNVELIELCGAVQNCS